MKVFRIKTDYSSTFGYKLNCLKQSLLICIGVFCLLTGSFGQSVKKSTVPAAVINAVESKYPNSSCTWEKEDSNYEATFKQNGIQLSLLVSPIGEILETESGIAITNLPAPAVSYLKQNYAGKRIRDAAMIVDRSGATTYEAALKGMDILFDSKGNFLKEVKD